MTEITKRAAVAAMLGVAAGGEAKAQASSPRFAWTVDLDNMRDMLITYQGRTLTLTAADIWAALTGGTP